MEINLSSKRSKLIILIIFFVIFAGTGGYLLWRVNQPESVAPEDSEAGGGAGACCIEGIGCVAGYRCDMKASCTATEKAYVGGYGPPCGTSNGKTVNCRSYFYCQNPGTNTCEPEDSANLGTCQPLSPGTPPSEGDCKDVKCEWPKVLMSGRLDASQDVCRCELCTGKVANNPYSCGGNPPTCTPGSCPSGTVSCGDSTNHESGSDCKKKSSISCVTYHPDCNNSTYVYRYCKPMSSTPPPTNVCDGGNWTGKPSGTYPYCSNIAYKFVAKDSDGVKKSSIVVKLNDTVRTNLTKSTIKEADKEVEVKETLSTSSDCLKPGEYTIKASWADTKDKTGPECSLTASFTVLEEEKNPDWDISKKVTEVCIDENTENPKSKLQYVVTITNSGEGAGKITSIVDTLDSKVLEGYIDSISANGKFQGGTIVWPVVAGDQEFNPGQSKTYTYSYVVPSTAFGVYNNTVKATPAVGNTLIANATISADCEVLEPEEEPVPDEEIPVAEERDLPESGIFDDSQASILLGVGLLLLGFTWRILGRGMYVSIELLGSVPKKVSIHMKDIKEDIRGRQRIRLLQKREQNRKKFEKRVVKE